MKNQHLVAQKTNLTLNKKESNLNFKQALSKKISKKSNKSSKTNKSLRKKNKLMPKKNKELIKNQITPFLTKNEMQVNSMHNSEKIRNLLRHAYNNNLSNNNSKFNNKNRFKNKSTANLCAPSPATGQKAVIKEKNTEIYDDNKSSKLNEFINADNNEINQDCNNNQNNVKSTNLAFLIAKNQNYDEDSIVFNINESYIDYVNNIQKIEEKKRIINNDKIKNENSSEEYSIKNNNLDNNDTNSLINSIININKFLTNEVNHKAVNNANLIGENNKSKPHRVYENQLPKTKELCKPKEEPKNNNNNENDQNINNINNNPENYNSNFNNNYKRQLINKVMKSKYCYTGKKPIKTQLMKKKQNLNLEEDNNDINNNIYFNTHSPKITIHNEIIKKLQFSPNVNKFNKTLFNNEPNLIEINDEKKNKKRIKVSKAKKYIVNSYNIQKESINIKNSNKENINNNINIKKNNIFNKKNEFNILNENTNNFINNNNRKYNNINYNIFDDDFYSNTAEFQNHNKNDNNQSQLNKYINCIDNFSNNKKNKKKNHNSSCHFIHPSISIYNKNNALLHQEKYNINNSNIEQNNSTFLLTQEEDNNYSKIQEIKIRLKNPPKINSSSKLINQRIIKNNNLIQNINIQNSAINIYKHKYNITISKSNDKIYNNNNESNKSKDRAKGSIERNKNKSFIYSSSKSPSYRINYNKFKSFKKDEQNFLNYSNDRILNQQIYIKQVSNNNIKYKTQNNFLKLKNEIKKTNGKNAHQSLKKENNNLNIKMNSLKDNYQTPEIKNLIIDNDDIYNISNNINNENNNNNFYTTCSFFHFPSNKSSNNLEIDKQSSSKIYIKPSKCAFKKNNLSNKIINFSPMGTPITEISLPNYNIFNSQKDDKYLAISYRNNNNLNNKKDNYLSDIEFINHNNINYKLNNNLILYNIHKTKTKAYIKKNKNINYNKKNNNIKIIKNKISNINNYRITKYYSYFISKKQIFKKLCYISKKYNNPKCLPLCKKSFMTKIIIKYYKRIKNNVCYIDKKIIKNKSNTFENKENQNLDKEINIIKANVLDFSLDHNKDSIYNHYYFISNYNNIKNTYHRDNDYQESVGEINLSFSNDEINTYKYKENNTIEAVFNELSNLNTLNNDSEIKVTFGHANTNNNFNNLELSTEGRIINDSFNKIKIKKYSKIPINYNRKINEKEDIVENLKNKDKTSSVIFCDNEEENEDIKINFESNKKIEKVIKDDISLDFKYNEKGNFLLKEKKTGNDLIPNCENMKNKKKINSKDVINFAEKLGNIFDKKNYNSNDKKDGDFRDINIYSSNFNIYENKKNIYKLQNLNNDDFINVIVPKCRTYAPKRNKYLEVLSNNDLTPLTRLELRIINEKKDFKQNSRNNKNNLVESENENNVTFNQSKKNKNEEILFTKDFISDKSIIEIEINYLLNKVSIGNLTDIATKLSEIIINNADINNKHNYIKNEYILTDIIIRRSISELKYSFLYIMLCQNLYFFLLKNENENQEENKNNNLKNIINTSLKNKFNEYLHINKSININFKNNILGIIYLINELVYSEMISIENGFDYLNILYNKYLNNVDNDNKNLFLEATLLFLGKFWKIAYVRKDLKSIEIINTFIEDKIKILLENQNYPKLEKPLFSEIINLINIKNNKWKLSAFEEYNINRYNNLQKINLDETNNKRDNEKQLNANEEIKSSNNILDYYDLSNVNYELLILLKNDLKDFCLNNNKNEEYNINLCLYEKFEIYDIIRYYIEICIDFVNNNLLVNKCNNYINIIIEKFSIKNNIDKKETNKIVDLILNIDDIIIDNKNMFQIMGYLLYSFINYEIIKIEDFNHFIGKEEYTLINVAIIIKYIIIYSNKGYIGDDYKSTILEEIKKTNLFKSNINLFEKYMIEEPLL